MNIKALNRVLLVKQTLFGISWMTAGALLPYLQKSAPLFELRAWMLMFVAFVSARFSGMCFNSYFDRSYDAKNPRTKDRPLPRGDISPTFCITQAGVYLAVFLWASWSINPLCGLLSLAVSTAIVLYSLTKRITHLCHFALGIIYFFAPFCAWAAIMGEISPVPFLFSLAFFLTIAGSDIVYACQDVEFDREIGLYSLPALMGIKPALTLSIILHVACAISIYFEGYLLGSTYLCVAACLMLSISGFSYIKLGLGQISYMAAFTRINMLSGLILVVFIVAHLLFS